MAEIAAESRFPTTRWSVIIAAGDLEAPGAREALAALCATYWYPIYAFIRRRVDDPPAAADLTQDYFARLMESDVLAVADRAKGRFRAFLRADCGYFLAHRRGYDRAKKRGGGVPHLTIDVGDAEGRFRLMPVDGLSPDRLFDRGWALTLLEIVLERLGREYSEAGRGELYERLQVILSEGSRAVPFADIAADLGMSVGAVQQAAHRLRRRFRDILRGQLAETLVDPTEEDIEDEVRDLFAALKR